MTEKYMVILFKKHKIAKNEFLYKPERTIIIREKDGNVFDENNNIVFPVHSLEACNDEVEYATDSFYCNYQTYLENNELEDIEEEIKEDYFDLNKRFYVYATTDNKEVQTTGINLGVNLGLNSDNLDYAKRILGNIKKRKYSKDELRFIRNSIKREELRATEIGKLYDEILGSEQEEKEEDEYQKRGLIDINGLYNKVTKTLVAQEEAAEDFITQLEMLDLDNTNRKGILLTGDSGVGKTKLVELVSKYLNRPFLFIDSTQLTMPGYVGKNIEEYLYDLIVDCNFNKDLAENAIVFFDEIDKKGSSKKSDVSGQGVLNQLLKFLDGETYSTYHDSSSKSQSSIKINTSNMIIVAGGAFNDVYHNIDDSAIIGFNKDNDEYSNTIDINIDDFVEKAQMPREFMGRFSVIHLNSLKSEDYERILKESDESPITSAENRFKEMDDVRLTFTDSFIEAAAQLASKREVGVRGLSEIITNSTKNPFRYVNQNLDKYKEVIIDDNILYDPDDYQLIEKDKTDEKGIQKVKK